jgi:hypothetical protein
MVPITIPYFEIVPIVVPDILTLPIRMIDVDVPDNVMMIPLHLLDIGDIPIVVSIESIEKEVKLIDPIKESEKHDNNDAPMSKAVERHFQHYKNKSVWWVVYCLIIAITASFMTYDALTSNDKEGFSNAVSKFEGYRYMHIKAPVVILYLYFRS